MKGRKLISLIIVLFATSRIVLAPNLDDQKLAEMRILNQIRIDQERRNEELVRFLEAVAYSESRGNPEAYNKYGYIGKYQFGFVTRKSCGYGYVRFSDFVKNPSIWSEEDQEKAMITLLSKNERHLKDVIHQYNGEIIKNMTITKSGILAAAHIAGAGGVKNYFRYGYNPKDAYGTSLEDYLIRFSGFNF